MPAQDLANALSGDFDKEVRKRDDQIRSLGNEINTLTKQKEILINDVLTLQNKLAIAQESLKSIDSIIAKKNQDFEDSKTKSIANLTAQETDLNIKKAGLLVKDKEQISKDNELKARQENIETMKKQAVAHIKDLIITINKDAEDFVNLIGDL